MHGLFCNNVGCIHWIFLEDLSTSLCILIASILIDSEVYSLARKYQSKGKRISIFAKRRCHPKTWFNNFSNARNQCMRLEFQSYLDILCLFVLNVKDEAHLELPKINSCWLANMQSIIIFLNLVISGQLKTIMIFEEVKIKIAWAGTPSKACLLFRVFICQLDVHGNLRLCTNIFFDLNHFRMNAMKIVLMN